MVRVTDKKEKYQHVEELSPTVWHIRWDYEDYKEPVVDPETGEPTGEYSDTDLGTWMEEMIHGELTVDRVKQVRCDELAMYDASPAVNEIIYDGQSMWFDKVTRTCITYSMNTEKAAGASTTTLYDNDGNAYVLPIDTAIQLFGMIELYAKKCYNTTAQHHANIMDLETIDEVLDYNFKTGYPPKINIDPNQPFNAGEESTEE